MTDKQENLTVGDWRYAIGPRPRRCGIHGCDTTSGRCEECDADIWECYGCGQTMPSLPQGWSTQCPKCGSYELHLADEAKRSAR